MDQLYTLESIYSNGFKIFKYVPKTKPINEIIAIMHVIFHGTTQSFYPISLPLHWHQTKADDYILYWHYRNNNKC